jgi:hypothetical protein
VRDIVNATHGARSEGACSRARSECIARRRCRIPCAVPGREARRAKPALEAKPAAGTTGSVVVFATCYGNRNEPQIVDDLVAVLEHNGIPVSLAASERCCGMPKLELGLEAVAKLKETNIPRWPRWSPRPRHPRLQSHPAS